MVLVFIQLSAYLVVPEYHHPILKILKIPGILKILILTRKGVCKNARPLQCNSIGRCTMIVIKPEPEQKGCFSYKDSEKRTPFCSFAVDRSGFYCAMFERLWHHHSVLKILKIPESWKSWFWQKEWLSFRLPRPWREAERKTVQFPIKIFVLHPLG